MSSSRPRALISGITGQDGSYLSEILLKRGYDVHGIVRRSSSFNTGRIDHLYRDPHESTTKLFLHYGDLNDSSSLQKILEDVNPVAVYNLGAQSHVRVSFDIPEYTAEVTALGAVRFLEAIRRANSKAKFYQASSSELFGSAKPPQSETTQFEPRSPYAAAKAYAFYITKNYREAYGMFAVNGILFNHESPRRGETFVTRKITRAIGRIKHGLQDKLFMGNLDAKRDWGFAGDYAEAMVKMLESDKPDDYVIATGETYSVREFLEASFSHAGLDWKKYVEIDPRYFRPAEVDVLLGDPTKAKKELGWEPKVDFKTLVKMMVDADMSLAEVEAAVAQRHLVSSPVGDSPGRESSRLIESDESAPVAPSPPAEVPVRLLGRFGGHLLAWAILAAVNLVVIAMGIRLTHGGALTRAISVFYDMGQCLGLGILSGGVALLWARRGPRSRLLAYAALTVLAVILGELVLREDVSGPAGRIARKLSPKAWERILCAVVSLSAPASAFLGSRLRKPLARYAAISLGISIAFGNGRMFHTSYIGAHFMLGWCLALFMGCAAEGAPIAARIRLPRVVVQHRLFLAAAIWGVITIATLPPGGALLQLLDIPSSILSPFLAQIRSREHTGLSEVSTQQREWFVDRSAFPPIEPSQPPLVAKNPIVILLSIDSTRADLFSSDKYAETLPNLTALRNESVYFAQAHSPGSSTGITLTSLFTSTYYSQQYWTTMHASDHTALYPFEDQSVRFPELLTKAGVKTITFAPQNWLMNEFGTARGFHEETLIGKTTRYPRAPDMMTPLIARLKFIGKGPAFFFVHFLDPHSPYNSAGDHGSQFDGYVAEVGSVDAQLGELRAVLKARHLEDRTTIIVMADHGEAFGEHDQLWHASTLYEELIHVPLLVHVPHVAPQRVEDRVSLMDLGPTILDLMGVATPGSYMGQSLTGYLRGEHPTLTRPIVAEGRLKRAMIMPDGFVVIEDTRNWTIQMFSLDKDPGELDDLFDEGKPDAMFRLGLLTHFFQVQTIKRAGYRPPFRF